MTIILEKDNLNFSKNHIEKKHKDPKLSNILLFEKEIQLLINKMEKISSNNFLQLNLEDNNDVQTFHTISTLSDDMSMKLSQVEYEGIEEIERESVSSILVFFLFGFSMIILFIVLFYFMIENKASN